MRAIATILTGMLFSHLLSQAALADCMAKAFREGDVPEDPIYEVISCGPAERIVEQLRRQEPSWYGTFTYTDNDVVVTVKAANVDAERLMWAEVEHWYFRGGCDSISAGMQFQRPQLSELCCDVGPVSTLPCGVGGKTLLALAP